MTVEPRSGQQAALSLADCASRREQRIAARAAPPSQTTRRRRRARRACSARGPPPTAAATTPPRSTSSPPPTRFFPAPSCGSTSGRPTAISARPVEAVAAFDRFLRNAGDAPPETLAEARRSAAELKTKLGQIQVTLRDRRRRDHRRRQAGRQHAAGGDDVDDARPPPGRGPARGVLARDRRRGRHRRQDRRRQHRAAADRSAAREHGQRMGRSWGPATRPPIRARRRSRPSIAGPGSGWRRAWWSPRARSPRSSSRAAARRWRSDQRRAGDDARRAEGVLMMRRWRLPLVLALLRGRGCVRRRRRRRRHPGGAVDRRDHAEPGAGRSRAASDPRRRPSRQPRHGQRPATFPPRPAGPIPVRRHARAPHPHHAQRAAGPHRLRPRCGRDPGRARQRTDHHRRRRAASTTRSRCQRRCAACRPTAAPARQIRDAASVSVDSSRRAPAARNICALGVRVNALEIRSADALRLYTGSSSRKPAPPSQ